MNDIETFAELTIQRMNDVVKKHSRNWLIAFGLTFIIFIVLVVVIFKHQKPTNESYEKQVRALDSLLKYQQMHVDDLERRNVEQDSIISHLNAAYKNNRTTETRIIHEYDKIPNTVHDLDREQLRSEVTNY